MDELPLADYINPTNAIISDCGQYRYRPSRRWGVAPAAMFGIGLGPWQLG